jgi:thioester reductase-like protein
MRIALTGATGFLGLRLVRELLSQHEALTVLTHSGSDDPVERISRFLRSAGKPEPNLRRRLRVVEIELAAEGLGLPVAAFGELADQLDLIVHCAGSIDLEADLRTMRAVNVAGMRHLLELAAAGTRSPLFCYVSTAFVAGRRRTGVVYEDELSSDWGFENPYEQSKYEAELLLRNFSARQTRPTVVVRPSILVDDQPPRPGLPRHTLQVVSRIVEAAVGQLRRTTRSSQRSVPTVRIPGEPGSHLNLLPVDDAARIIARLAQTEPSGSMDTYHVVHENDVATTELLEVFERLFHVRSEVAGQSFAPPSLDSPTLLIPGFAPYLRHRRRYDDSHAKKVPGTGVPIPRIDADYLLNGLRTALTSEGAVR